ncbi:MAG TPA: NnrU family protein [Burkholderiales bacterium]|nr:NnrU family protein [Burkholderiales bacterium]
MGLLILGLVIFFGVHLIPGFRPVRGLLVARVGEGAYKGILSLVSFAALGMVAWGKSRAQPIPLWNAPEWGRFAALWFMPLAFVSITAAFIPSNFRRCTAHPMLWGVLLWALLHLLANSDLASLLLFGSFGLYSLYAMWSQNLRGAKPSDARHPLPGDAAAVAIGLAAYFAVLHAHRWLFGAAVI